MKKSFWKKFDNLMEALPDFIDSEISNTFSSTSTTSSTSVINQNGNKIEVITKNGKTTIKVNGKEYVEKKDV